jgi:hypothetical protein
MRLDPCLPRHPKHLRLLPDNESRADPSDCSPARRLREQACALLCSATARGLRHDVAKRRHRERAIRGEHQSVSAARYVDPNNRRLMHEAHTICRVETTPRWNLHSNQLAAVQRGPATRTSNTVSETAPARDELIVELNRQKDATKAVIQGSQTVSQKLGPLGESVQQTKQVAAENLILRREVDATQQRLNALEGEPPRQKQSRPSSPAEDRSEKSDW